MQQSNLGKSLILAIFYVEVLWNLINRHFSLAKDAEVSIEINPKYVDKNYIFFLKSLGFNRISFGIQDFNPQVQTAINRVQPESMLFDVMEWIRDAGFESVNVDLIYGLPYRNFQGYTTKPESDLFGFGITSISMLHDVYVQNNKRLKDYYQAIDTGIIPIEKGVSLKRDDILRRAVIMELMCQFKLSINDVEEKYHIAFDTDFHEYFSRELSELQLLESDGLIRLLPNGIEVTPTGRLLVRNIASIFDAHTRVRKHAAFSKAI